jgi:hypothetical protein
MRWPIGKTPWALIVVLSYAIAKLMGAQLVSGSIPGLVFISAGVIALILEFMRSADITVFTFKLDLAMSILSLLICAVVTTCIFTLKLPFGFVDVIIWAIVLADAWLGPVNSFKTALRNITTDVGIGQPSSKEGENQ